VTAIVTAAPGFDLDYVWRGLGGGEAQPGGDYYLGAAEKGEAPGVWFGRGAAELGFETGQQVEREPYDAVYSQVHQGTGEQLGRRPSSGKYEEHLSRLTAAEPHATVERLRELEREAAQVTRRSPAYTDLTVSWSKSISMFHASLREQCRQARLSGSERRIARWERELAEFEVVLQEANRVALEHLENWAGYTRTGNHGARVDDQEPGRYERCKVVVSSWLQSTSRDGEPQTHEHNLVARMGCTDRDGKWRAIDTKAIAAQLPAMQAVATTHLEHAMTHKYGAGWLSRADGKGKELAGIAQATLDLFSSRRQAIVAKVRQMAADYEAEHGRAPSQHWVHEASQKATLATRHGKEDTETDWDGTAQRWDRKLGGKLAQIALDCAPGLRGTGTEQAQAQPVVVPDAQARQAAVDEALHRVQAQRSTWTRADLIKHIGACLPTTGLAPRDALVLLRGMTDDAVSGFNDDVVPLEVPEFPRLPDYLRRELDGRSVYKRPGTERYATHMQLSLEERLVHLAQRETAPALDRAQVAAELGANADALEAQLHSRAQDAQHGGTGSGLRMDQAAALFEALTSPRVASVLVGPAGSGKTRSLAEAARIWQASGRTVIGITTAQAARNVLTQAGIAESYNSSVFLGHGIAERGRYGPKDFAPGTLLVVDEASMMSTMDMADIMALARDRQCKVLMAGDHGQLTAVEGGGGMHLLCSQLGFVQLAEPVRFDAQWERDASLRLRSGDASVLTDYDQHGRIIGADPEATMENAASAYLAHYLAGQDVLLMASERSRCRELGRRIREELVHLGKVSDGQTVDLAEGGQASMGDLIICRQNDHGIEAGEPGRTVANGDVLRVEAITERGVMVRRLLDADRETGAVRLTEAAFEFGTANLAQADLGYAVTGHSAQGRTVRTAEAVFTGGESRQWAYVAMSRATHSNVARVMTVAEKAADPTPGDRPAPEIERYDRKQAERDGLPIPESGDYRPGLERREAIGIFSEVVERDGAELSALEYHDRALANADHLGILNVVLTGETDGPRRERYAAMVNDALPEELRGDLGPKATWLYRTLRAAEAAGLDARQVVDQAVAQRSLNDAEDPAAVIDARIRRQVEKMAPRPMGTWAEYVEGLDLPEGEQQRYAAEVAGLMDRRKVRLGEHAAETYPLWAAAALGPVPEHPVDRLEWERRASEIAAYRELYAFDHPTEAVGPEPTNDTPEKRAAWAEGFGAMTRTDEVDLRGRADGSLWHMRSTYAAETGWAPVHVGRELRALRVSASQAELAEMNARNQAEAARKRGDEEAAERQDAIAAAWQANGEVYRGHEGEFEQQQAARAEWEHHTAGSRHLAIAADSELRRRYPERDVPALVSAEPVVTEQQYAELTALPSELTGEYRQPEWIGRMAEDRQTFAEKLAQRQNVEVPSEDHEYGSDEIAWPERAQVERDQVLQPPRPLIKPAPEVTGAEPERNDLEHDQ
jgi:conjugative relaxase-like TrwC/TraI family protein